MTTPIVTGDTTTILVTLKKNNESFEIATDSTVLVTIVSTFHTKITTGEPIKLYPTDQGANWNESLVSIGIPGSFTSGIQMQGRAYLEIQVDDGINQTTWFVLVKIIKGNIQ